MRDGDGSSAPVPTPASAVGLLLQRLAQDVAEARARIGRTILGDRLLLLGDLQRLDREVRLLRPVETDHHRIELLADLEALGALLVAVAAEIGTLDEAGGPVVTDLDLEPAVADLEHGHGDRLALVGAARCSGAAL